MLYSIKCWYVNIIYIIKFVLILAYFNKYFFVKVEAEYQAMVTKLENENKLLKGQTSEQEGRVTNFPNKDTGHSPNDAFASLSRKLMLSEQNEHDLKNRICDLERREREVNERLAEQKRCYNDLVNQLQDNDIALKKITSLEQENSDLLDQIEHLKEVERRFKEVHQSEEFLQGRVEELEQTESVKFIGVLIIFTLLILQC